MFVLVPSKAFSKGLKKYRHNAKAITATRILLLLLQKDSQLHKKYRLHKLKGQSAEFWECHIMPDLLLIFRKDTVNQHIILIDIGSHVYLGLE